MGYVGLWLDWFEWPREAELQLRPWVVLPPREKLCPRWSLLGEEEFVVVRLAEKSKEMGEEVRVVGELALMDKK